MASEPAIGLLCGDGRMVGALFSGSGRRCEGRGAKKVCGRPGLTGEVWLVCKVCPARWLLHSPHSLHSLHSRRCGRSAHPRATRATRRRPVELQLLHCCGEGATTRSIPRSSVLTSAPTSKGG